MSFEIPIQLTDEIQNKLLSNGIEAPFPVQVDCAKTIYEGNDLKIVAPTGSGKTLAYLLPIGMSLLESRKGNLIVLASSPELSSQIHSVFKEYFPSIDSVLIVGGANLRRQKERLKTRPRAIFATPGRLFELFCLEYVKIDGNTTVVMDECDSLISGNNYDKVFSLAEGAGQLITASATFAEDSLAFLDELPQDIHDVEVKHREGTVKHAYIFCSEDKKEIALIKVLEQKNVKRAIVFVNSLNHVRHLTEQLRKNSYKVAFLDSETGKNEREKTVKSLRDGKINIIVSTDSLARGIDLPDLTVIQYGIARDEATYLHRAGRSGRAGATGWNISLVSKKDSFVLFKYVKSLKIELEEIKPGSRKRESGRKQNSFKPKKGKASISGNPSKKVESLKPKKKKKKNRVNKDKGKRRKKM